MDEQVTKLLKKRLYIGTSSWKYLGWKKIVYKNPYTSEKQFNDQCLMEYAQNYPCVGVDHTYYSWPTTPLMKKYSVQTPQHFRFGLKVTEKLTVFKYPKFKRYGKDAGSLNKSFLDPGLFREKFLSPLTELGEKVGPIIFGFSQFYPGTIASGQEFVERLDNFFVALRGSPFSFAVELRNANWLQQPYFEVLQKHSVSHVFNSWTRMPTIGEQLEVASGAKLPSYVCRLLLVPGTKYEQAVEAFSPYDKIQEEFPQVRDQTAQLLQRAVVFGVPAFVFVNNRAEGCAPVTIAGILESYKRLK